MSKGTPVTEKEQAEMVQLYNEGTSAKEIAAVYKRTPSIVYYWLNKAGAALKRPKGNGSNGSVVVSPLQTIEDQIADLKRKLVDAEAKKAALSIRFEWADETTIIVHGVTELFIAKEGLAKLKWEIEHHTPQKRVDQHG